MSMKHILQEFFVVFIHNLGKKLEIRDSEANKPTLK